MVDTRVHEIANSLDIDISGPQLVTVCQNVGMDHIRHHLQSVTPQEAERIRKLALAYQRGSESISTQDQAATGNVPERYGFKEELVDLKSILDLKQLQRMMEDFYRLSDIPVSLIDTDGEVLAGAGWQRICTEFHRKHPVTRKNCIQSDTALTTGVPEGEFKIYKCKNGLWDAATPVVIEGETLGNVFTGQFFFEGEETGSEYFKKQAECYGFDKDNYMETLRQVPVFKRHTVNSAMEFFSKLANFISRQGYTNLNQRQSEKRYRGLIESQNDLIVRVDPENRFTYVNDTYCKTFGKARDELIGSKFLPLVHEDDRDSTLEAMEALKKPPYRVSFEQRAFTVYGWRWIHWEDNAILDEDGEIVEIQGVGRDITEIKEKEKAVREERDYMFQIFDAMQPYVFVESPDYQIEFMNRKANEDFGDLVGEKCYKEVGRNTPCPQCPMPKLMGSCSGEAIRYQVEAFDRIFEGSATKITNLDGSTSVLEVLSDMTERVRQERTIRYMSFHDPLTDLYNRSFAAEELKRLDTDSCR